jgi:hypothetical protein
MKFITLALSLIVSYSSLAQTFSPIKVQTAKFKMKTSREFTPNRDELTSCQIQTTLNAEKSLIEFRMGIVGSEVSYFGWDMNIALSEFPLKAGFKKIFKTPGVSGMILTYDGSKLNFEWDKATGLWNRLYPFSLTIDPELKSPKKFEGRLEGYEMTIFGKPKKHIVQTCDF